MQHGHSNYLLNVTFAGSLGHNPVVWILSRVVTQSTALVPGLSLSQFFITTYLLLGDLEDSQNLEIQRFIKNPTVDQGNKQ